MRIDMAIFSLLALTLISLKLYILQIVPSKDQEEGDCTSRTFNNGHRLHKGRVDKIGGVHLPSLLERTPCNFVRDGKYSDRGRASIRSHHQPGIIFPSWNVRQKVAVATMYTLWLRIRGLISSAFCERIFYLGLL